METKKKEIKEAIHELAKKNNAILALLFGSYGRGTQTKHSDLDVIFVQETDKPFLKRLDPYFFPLSELMGAAVDVFVYTPQEYRRMKKKFFVQRALKEGEIIFESRKL
ncbi:MAG: nucleotidyltransferase domain-containing protein [Candidatus Humimicrobiaceae bacterium]